MPSLLPVPLARAARTEPTAAGLLPPRLAYQPVATRTADARWTVTGVEVLVRAPAGSTTASTAQYLADLATAGALADLFVHVLDAGLAQLAEWDAAGLHLRLAVNLHADALGDPNLATLVGDLLLRHGLPGSRLLLEIGESTPIDDLVSADLALCRLRALGVSVAIDDFGAGHASLTRVDALDCDELKIDRSLVTQSERSAELRRAVANAVAHGHARCMRVCAEGVETAAVLALVGELGCDRVQGYLIGAPDAAAAIPALVARWHARAAA